METVQYNTDEIVSFKLVNGDEIVARVLYDEREQWGITQPLTVIPAQSGGIMMIPSMMSVDANAEFRLPKRQVMLDALSAVPVADHYREITTGIKAVRKPGIVLG